MSPTTFLPSYSSLCLVLQIVLLSSSTSVLLRKVQCLDYKKDSVYFCWVKREFACCPWGPNFQLFFMCFAQCDVEGKSWSTNPTTGWLESRHASWGQFSKFYCLWHIKMVVFFGGWWWWLLCFWAQELGIFSFIRWEIPCKRETKSCQNLNKILSKVLIGTSMNLSNCDAPGWKSSSPKRSFYGTSFPVPLLIRKGIVSPMKKQVKISLTRSPRNGWLHCQ
jgi:hypothetical protein